VNKEKESNPEKKSVPKQKKQTENIVARAGFITTMLNKKR